MIHKEKPIVISIGGSLIAPDNINVDFLQKLNSFIRGQVKKGRTFFLVTGGGKPARQYRDAGKAVIGTLSSEDLDWLGIHASRLNGHLLRTIFQDIAHPRIIENYDKKLQNWKEPVVIGAGWKPGWSTDYCAVYLAKDYGAELLINLSNIDWIYDRDPRKFKDAKPIKKMTWEDCEKIVGDTWTPGLNAPFDPIATQLAKQQKLTAIIANGEDFNNLEKVVSGEPFKGTTVLPQYIDATYYDREYYTGKKGEYRVGYIESPFGRVIHGLTHLYRALLIKIFLNPKNCLDLGCGTGKLIKSLRFFGIEAYGVDVSEQALELVDPDMKPYVKQADITTKLPYEDDQFDLVLSFDVLEHLERNKIKKAVDESIRVSRKYILHKIYTQENVWINILHAKDVSHVSVFGRKFWQRLFFENDKVSLLRSTFFYLPAFFETIFLLKKK